MPLEGGQATFYLGSFSTLRVGKGEVGVEVSMFRNTVQANCGSSSHRPVETTSKWK